MQHAVNSQGPTTNSLVTLLQLARRARHAADASELAFMLVNETFVLSPYRQAAFWLRDTGVRALSGVSAVETNAPFVQWLKQLAKHLEARSERGPSVLTANDVPEELRAQWTEWLPAYLLWLPLEAGQEMQGALLLAREETWNESDRALIVEWTDTWLLAWRFKNRKKAHVGLTNWLSAVTDAKQWRTAPQQLLAALAPKRIKQTLIDLWRVRSRRYGVLACMFLMLPVRLTVLATGELVPADPAIIRAPFDGVIDQVNVQPNQHVHAGQPLFSLDHTVLSARLAVAKQALVTTQSEYRQQAQLALYNAKSKAQLAVLQGTIAERQADVAYLEQQLARSVVTAPYDGIVLFDAPSEWLGRPVSTGERIASVANEHDVEVEAWLAPGDLIAVQASAPVTLYLNTDPLSPVTAKLRYILYEATQRPDGSFAYRLRATLDEHAQRQRIGLKGTAKVAGERVPLIYWLLRRPFAMTRQFIGW